MASEGGRLPYPRGALFILFGYLLERFVYYGLFGGAVFYMQRVLGFTSSSAKTAKAVLEGLIYLAPVVGAVLADTYLGKARTVFMMCCGYTVGAAVFILSSATPIMASVEAARFTGVLGLLVLGLCAGLMKAVYSSLGADQFRVPEQRRQQERFFYAFYWMINAGAFLGMFMTAQLRDTVQCFGDDCYFLPFAILVGLMVLSTAIFAAGRSRYREAPPDPMLLRALQCIACALRRRWTAGGDGKPVDHWLDRAADRHDARLLADVKATLRVLLLFCTYPLFWALFYQTSTGMIFQAKRLDGLVGGYRIPPEMSSTVNPLLILTLIPLFDGAVYPACGRLGLLARTSSRMVAGMAFAVCAFVVYALVNTRLEQALLAPSEARLRLYNALPCPAALRLPSGEEVEVEGGGQAALPTFAVGEEEPLQLLVATPSCPPEEGAAREVEAALAGGHETTLVVAPGGVAVAYPPTLEYIKDEDAEAKVRVLVPGGGAALNVTLKYDALEERFEASGGGTPFRRMSPKEYAVVAGGAEIGEAPVYQDGVYDVVVVSGGGGDLLLPKARLFAMTAPAGVHMLWLLPQYVLITVGEVLFSVSGMDFAYSQAPAAMKSILQAANLLTITVGLWLFAGLTSLGSATGAFRHRPSHEALLYAGLMAADTAAFVVLLRWYHRGEKGKDADEGKGKDADEGKGKDADEGDKKDADEGDKKDADEGGGAVASHDNPAFLDDHSV